MPFDLSTAVPLSVDPDEQSARDAKAVALMKRERGLEMPDNARVALEKDISNRGGGKSGFDLSTATPVTPQAQPVTREELTTNHPTEQPDEGIPFIGGVVGVPEALASMGTGALGSIAGPIAGVGAQLLTGANGPQVAQKVQSALTYEPRSSAGKKIVEGVGKLVDESKIAGLGPSEAMALSGATPRAPIAQSIKGVNRVEDTLPGLKRTGGAAAKTVTDELQRQRTAMETGKPTGGSEYERAAKDFDERMKPLKDEALRSPVKVNTKDAIDTITALEAKNPDGKVRAALNEVRKTIKRAVGGAQTSALPTAGSKVTPAQLKEIRGAGDNLSMDMADEVRQSINRMIAQKGDGALDAHTKDVLAQVREVLLKDAPPEYKSYLTQFGEGKQALERFNPEQTGVGKVTSTEKGYQPLAPGEAQDALGKIFSGDRKARDLKSYVDATAHDPKTQQGLRQSYVEWLAKPDAVTKQVKSGDLLKRWESTRDAVKSSGLMTEKHAGDVDKVVADIRKVAAGGHIRRGVTTTLGYLMGYHVGHGLRNIIRESSSVSPKNMRALESVLAKVVADPKAMELLSAPPTRANLDRLKQSAIDLAPFVIPQAARSPNPVGMQPAGL